MALKPEVSYPGAGQWLDFSYTCSQGITPGSATLTIAPTLDQVAAVGDLVFGDGQNSVALRDCRVVNYQYGVDGSGQRVTLLLQDRRWRWQFGYVSGRYNIPEDVRNLIPLVPTPDQPQGNQFVQPPTPPKGEEAIKPETKKTAPDLAKLCLKAMGETRYDVSKLDPTATPTVEWDVTNPAAALQALAEQLGCRVVFRPDLDGVVIVKQGDGADLPDGSFLSAAPTLEARAAPSKVAVVGARTKYQQRFALDAVGEEFDGGIRLNDDLSYRPASGNWQNSQPPNFGGIPRTGLPGNRTYYDALALAQKSVFRYYRIKSTGADGKGDLKVPPDDDFPVSIEQVRLLPFRLLITKDDAGRTVQLPARCIGKHTRPKGVKLGLSWSKGYEQTNDDSEVLAPFTIDPIRQLIIFSEHVYALKTDGKVYPAEIVLECACEVQARELVKVTRTVREKDGTKTKTKKVEALTNFQYRRYFVERDIPGGVKTELAVTVREDVEHELTATYGSAHSFQKVLDNGDRIQPRVDYYLAAEVAKYNRDAAATATYAGVQAIYPDGAIQQVTWTLGGGACQTQASRNTEHAIYLPPFAARRRLEEGNIEQQRRVQEWHQKHPGALDRLRRWAHANG